MVRFILVTLAAVFAILAYYGTPEMAGGQGSPRAATSLPELRPLARHPVPPIVRAAESGAPAAGDGAVLATLPPAVEAIPAGSLSGLWVTAQENDGPRGLVSASHLSQ